MQDDPVYGLARPKIVPKQILAVQRSLKAQGISFEVEQDEEWITVRACGKAKRRKISPPKLPGPPPAPNQVQARKHRELACKQFEDYRKMLPGRLKNQYRDHGFNGTESPEKRKAQKKIGHALARIIACCGDRDGCQPSQQDYREIDKAFGSRVHRKSEIGKRYDTWTQYVCTALASGNWTKHAAPEIEPVEATAVRTYQELKLDVEYWQELERLAGGFYADHGGKEGVIDHDG